MTKWQVRVVGLGASMVLAVGIVMASTYADPLVSPHYRFDESTLGGGGLVQSSSPHYQSAESIGDTAVGNTSSTNYQIETGSKTTGDPTLGFSVNNATPFEQFSAGGTATATSTFSVSNYTSYGYIVQIVGTPLSNGPHTIPDMATTGDPLPGVEQFGINLVANTSPKSFGANPDHGQFGFGDPTPNYGTPNKYRFVSGETIASAPKSSGVTKYTVSYIADVDSLTPGGKYSSDEEIICTGTF